MRVFVSSTVRKMFALGSQGCGAEIAGHALFPQDSLMLAVLFGRRMLEVQWEQAQPRGDGGCVLAWETVLHPLLRHKISVRCRANF